MKYVVLDPGSSEPTYGPLDQAVIIEAADDAAAEETMHDWQRHPVFVTDDEIVVTCDLCDGPQRVEGDDWNGETGNHYSCENLDHIGVNVRRVTGGSDHG